MGLAPTPSASSPARSRGCSTPRWRPTRSGPTPSVASRRSPSPRARSKLGLPSLHSGYWDPLWPPARRPRPWSACTSGSSSWTPVARPRTHRSTPSACCSSATPCSPAADWLYSRIPVRFPKLKIVPLRGRHRLGARPARPPRPRAATTRSSTARGRDASSRPARCSSATSGSAPSTIRRRSGRGPHRGRPTSSCESRLPARRLDLAATRSSCSDRNARGLPDDDAQDHPRNAAPPVPSPASGRGRLRDVKGPHARSVLRGHRRRRHRRPRAVADVGVATGRIVDRRAAMTTRRRDGRRRRARRRSRLRRHPHPLRRAAVLGSDRQSVAAARCHDRHRRQLRLQPGARGAADEPTT